jgi:hypothetical protein
MVMITCPKCGQHVLDVASSCPKCGHVLMQNPLETGDGAKLSVCRRCGKHIERDAIRCPFCGHHVQRSRLLRRTGIGVVTAAVVVAGGVALVRAGILPSLPWKPKGGPAAAAEPANRAPAPPATATPLVVAPPETTAARVAPPPPPTAPPAAAPTPASTSLVSLRVKWTMEWANVRAERTSASTVVRVLGPGARVEIGDPSGGWWAVYENGAPIGYIANSLLGDVPPGP